MSFLSIFGVLNPISNSIINFVDLEGHGGHDLHG